MITKDQFFIGRPHTAEQEACAVDLLSKVNPLLNRYTAETGLDIAEHVHTNSMVAPAGSQGFDEISGIHEGGFRLPDCPQGSKNSSHKIIVELFDTYGEGAGVDVYDPEDALDNWLTDEILAEAGLYREHPGYTHHWCHLTNRAPGSGHRTFIP